MVKYKQEEKVVVDIIGAGAMGLLFASRLKIAGHKVRIWCNRTEQTTYIKNHGIHFIEKIESTDDKHIHFDEVYSFNNQDSYSKTFEPSAFTVIAIKQSGFNNQFLSQLHRFAQIVSKSPFVCIQNGIGHIELLQKQLKDGQIIQAVTSEAALKMGQDVAHTGYGMTYLSATNVSSVTLQFIEQCLNNAGIETLVSKSIEEFVYNKLIVNAVINPLTAIYRLPNGQLPLNAARLKLMQLLFEESKTIIEQTSQIELSISFEHILQVCKKTSLNNSSMFTDILNGRTTEIDAINGAIVSLATSHQLQAPINETVYLLVLAQHP